MSEYVGGCGRYIAESVDCVHVGLLTTILHDIDVAWEQNWKVHSSKPHFQLLHQATDSEKGRLN